MADRKPIGYWLKELDRLIEGTLDRALADEGVTRRDWQVLNALEPDPAPREASDRGAAAVLGRRGGRPRRGARRA